MVILNKRCHKNKRSKRQTKRRKNRQSGGNKHTTLYPPVSIKRYISHVVYVNLDSRADRKAQIEKELAVFDSGHVHRVPGIVPEVLDMANRNVALAKAHLNAVKLAIDNKWENTLFLEDDVVWANIEKAYPIFEKLVQQPYDAIMLGGHHSKYDKETFRVTSATNGSAYLLHKSHYKVYFDKLQAMINSFQPGITKHEDVQVDRVVFGPLQKDYNWFLVVPSLMIQLPGYSDRVGETIDFTSVNSQ